MIKIETLENGINLVVEDIKEVESVVIKFVVNAGARNENIENTGISHFLEHMAFKGTEKRSAKQIAIDFENIGASFNAYTSKETTAFYVKVLKEYFKDAFEILSDLFLNSVFDEEELEKERGVILQELAMTNDTPDDIVFEYFEETAFPNQQMGRSIIGLAENIKKFQKSDFQEYLNNNYTAENIIISICGNIDFEETKKVVFETFSKVKKGKKHIIEKGEYKGGYFKKIKKDLEQFQCIIGFNGFSYYDKKYFKQLVGNFIFGGSLSSRLFQEIRENRGLCYTVSSGNTPSFDCGVFKIYVGAEPEKINYAIDGIIEEFKKFIDKGVSDEELKRAKIKIKSSTLMSAESITNKCSGNASDYLKYKKIFSLQEIADFIEETTKEDIKNIFTDVFNSNPTLTLYGSNDNVYGYEDFKNKIKE